MSSNSYSPTRRFITTVVLILLIATVIPYQFAYLVLVIVQILTSVRAHGQSINTVCIIFLFDVIMMTLISIKVIDFDIIISSLYFISPQFINLDLAH